MISAVGFRFFFVQKQCESVLLCAYLLGFCVIDLELAQEIYKFELTEVAYIDIAENLMMFGSQTDLQFEQKRCCNLLPELYFHIIFCAGSVLEL
jgi:hypothetical protein